jgi:hypothetical protein
LPDTPIDPVAVTVEKIAITLITRLLRLRRFCPPPPESIVPGFRDCSLGIATQPCEFRALFRAVPSRFAFDEIIFNLAICISGYRCLRAVAKFQTNYTVPCGVGFPTTAYQIAGLSAFEGK